MPCDPILHNTSIVLLPIISLFQLGPKYNGDVQTGPSVQVQGIGNYWYSGLVYFEAELGQELVE